MIDADELMKDTANDARFSGTAGLDDDLLAVDATVTVNQSSNTFQGEKEIVGKTYAIKGIHNVREMINSMVANYGFPANSLAFAEIVKFN